VSRFLKVSSSVKELTAARVKATTKELLYTRNKYSNSRPERTEYVSFVRRHPQLVKRASRASGTSADAKMGTAEKADSKMPTQIVCKTRMAHLPSEIDCCPNLYLTRRVLG
jgi:hypothetical protein